MDFDIILLVFRMTWFCMDFDMILLDFRMTWSCMDFDMILFDFRMTWFYMILLGIGMRFTPPTRLSGRRACEVILVKKHNSESVAGRRDFFGIAEQAL